MEDKYYLYFIENHEKNRNKNISINLNDNKKQLDKIYNYEKEIANSIYEISIYRFEIEPNKYLKDKKSKQFNLSIILTKDNKDSFELKIDINEINQDRNCFLFNIKFESIKSFIFEISPPRYITLSCPYIYDMYMKVLKNVYQKNINDKEIQDLIFYAQKNLNEPDDKSKIKHKIYIFLFIDIFFDLYEMKDSCKTHLLSFDINQIEGNENYSNSNKKNEINIKVNKILDNIKMTFDYFGNNKEINEKLVLVFLCYNFSFQKEQINKMFENKSIADYLFDILLQHKEKFQNLNLNTKSMSYLVQKAKTFNQIEEICLFNNNFLDLLGIINKNNLVFYEKHSKEQIRFSLENCVKPKLEDNLPAIFQEIIKLIDFENKLENFYMTFNDKIFDRYMEIYKSDNFNNIVLIYNIEKYIINHDKFSTINNLNKNKRKIIKLKGKILSGEKKLNNEELLNFFENPEFFTNDEFFKLLKKFDINTMDENFFVKWKEKNIYNKYKNYIEKNDNYYKILCRDVKTIKDFGNLFRLFDIGTNLKDYNKESLINMEKTLKVINNINNNNNSPKYIEEIINLIYYSEKKEFDVTLLINDFLLINNSHKVMSKIFKGVISKKDNLSKGLTDIIIKFFIENIEESNSSTLFFIIKNSNSPLIDSILSYLSNYKPTKEDFFSKEEKENIKLFNNLLKMNFLTREKLSDCYYLNQCNSFIDNLINDLKEGNIEYKYINHYYINNKTNIFYGNLQLITKNDKEKETDIKNKVDEWIKNINEIYEDLNLIGEYLKLFYPSEKYVNDKIDSILKNKNEKYINYYTSLYQDYSELITKYKNEAISNIIYKDSKIFHLFNTKIKLIKNYDDNKSLLETKKFMEILKLVLKENQINSQKININDLENYIKILDINNISLNEEIEKLIKIFKISNDVNTNKISKELILLNQRHKIKSLINSFLFCVEQLKLNKTHFYSILNVIKNNLNKSKEINVIELSKSILVKNNYDIDNINNKNLEILIELGENPDKIKFLFDIKNHNEEFFKKIKKINDENNNDFIGVEKCISFISKYLNNGKNKNYKDKEMINNFLQEIEKNKEMINYFDNYINKYELLTKKII